MPIMRFYVAGNEDADVIGVGLRLTVSALASKHELQIAPRNLYEENKVEVIIRGSRNAIQNLCREIQDEDVRIFNRKGSYLVTEPEIYEGIKPDWLHYRTMLTIEQLQKGIIELTNIADKLVVLNKVTQKLDKLTEKLTEIVSFASIEKIDTKIEKR